MSLSSRVKMVWKFIKARDGGAIQERRQMDCLSICFRIGDERMSLAWPGLRLLEVIPHEGPGSLAEPQGGWGSNKPRLASRSLDRLSYSLASSLLPCRYQCSIFQPLYSDERRMRRKEMRCQGKTIKVGKNITEECPGNGREWPFRNVL